MTKKQYLERLIDIGGVATINNFYSPTAKRYDGSLLQARRFFQFFESKGLVKRLDPIINPRNPAQEVYYAITKLGANLVGKENYKWKDNTKPILNVLHESMKFDIALSWLNLIDHEAIITYPVLPTNLRPDLRIRSKGKKYLVEIERKKTTSRTTAEKFKRYYNFFNDMKKSNWDSPKNYVTLFVYAPTNYNALLRPQQYIGDRTQEIIDLTKYLASTCKEPYLFMAFPDFHRLNEKVWFDTSGNRVSLI